MRLGIGPWATAFDVVVGQLEPSRVQRNLEFFHIPLVVLRGGLPCFAPGHPLNPGLDGRDRYPFAFAVADLAGTASRLDAIEAALALPDAQALPALLALKRIRSEAQSSLLPASGLPALADTPLAQRAMSIGERRRARELGARLADFRAFTGCPTRSARRWAPSRSRRTSRRRHDHRSRRGRPRARPDRIRPGRDPRRRTPLPIAIGPGGCLGAGGVLSGVPAPAGVVARTPDAHAAPVGGRLPLVPARAARGRTRAAEARGPGAADTAALEPDRVEHRRDPGRAARRRRRQRDPALRNPDSMAAGLVTAQPRVVALAKVPGARWLLPSPGRAPGAGRIPLRDRARQAHRRGPRGGAQRGLDQLVILGAGYDSRPYRFAEALRDIRVFEVDLP